MPNCRQRWGLAWRVQGWILRKQERTSEPAEFVPIRPTESSSQTIYSPSAGDTGVFYLGFHYKYLLLPLYLGPQLAEGGQGTSQQLQGFGAWSKAMGDSTQRNKKTWKKMMTKSISSPCFLVSFACNSSILSACYGWMCSVGQELRIAQKEHEVTKKGTFKGDADWCQPRKREMYTNGRIGKISKLKWTKNPTPNHLKIVSL